MINSDIIQSVLKIKFQNRIASAFGLNHEGHKYLVTAYHLFNNMTKIHEIEVMRYKQWRKLEVSYVGHCKQSDVAIFFPTTDIPVSSFVKFSPHGAIYGQDVYFLGFPFGPGVDAGGIHHNLSIPLIKKACLSGEEHMQEKYKYFLLDGHFADGFSGGPVAIRLQNSTEFRVIGTISGYRNNQKQVYLGNKATGMHVISSTGIIYASNIKHAIDIININPIGYRHA